MVVEADPADQSAEEDDIQVKFKIHAHTWSSKVSQVSCTAKQLPGATNAHTYRRQYCSAKPKGSICLLLK